MSKRAPIRVGSCPRSGREGAQRRPEQIGAGTSEIRRMLIGRELFAETM
jgi:hypothetical protein